MRKNILSESVKGVLDSDSTLEARETYLLEEISRSQHLVDTLISLQVLNNNQNNKETQKSIDGLQKEIDTLKGFL